MPCLHPSPCLPADSLVDYGTTTVYDSTESDITLVTSHSIVLTNLTMGTEYHFMVTSTNEYGFASSSGDNTFTTLTPITLTITSPLDNDTINRSDVMVRGTVSNTTGNETGITVNGIVAVVYNGEFFVNHVPLEEGQNTITANAVDTADNTATTSITVTAVLTGVIVKSGVWQVNSSGGLIDCFHLDSIFKFDSCYHLSQVIEPA